MIRSASRGRGARIYGVDGEIGKIDDLYFDDRGWQIRYLVAMTGEWLEGRRVLLSPQAVRTVSADGSDVRLDLTTGQVRQSPPTDTAKPVSREYESKLHDHYGWDHYRGESYGSSRASRGAPPEEAQLRRAGDVTGYRVLALDGALGEVDDLLIDDESWGVRFAVISTGPPNPGKRLLVSRRWIREVDWPEREMTVGLSRREAEEAPEWQGSFAAAPAGTNR